MPGWTCATTTSRRSAFPFATTNTQLVFPSVFTAVDGTKMPPPAPKFPKSATTRVPGRSPALTTSASTSTVRFTGSTIALFTRTFAWNFWPPGEVFPSMTWPGWMPGSSASGTVSLISRWSTSVRPTIGETGMRVTVSPALRYFAVTTPENGAVMTVSSSACWAAFTAARAWSS